MHFPVAMLALAAALVLAGCGQMGPLYLPEEAGAPAPPTPAATAPAAITAQRSRRTVLISLGSSLPAAA